LLTYPIRIGLLIFVSLVLSMGAQTVCAESIMPGDSLSLVDWTPKRGDRLIADTKENIGYLLHDNGEYISFRIATGQKRVVRYIGRTYDARTPERVWAAREKQTKGDRITFGPEGTFLRLFTDNVHTPYGIHSHRSISAMLTDTERYKSMGCILVSKEILDIIVQTFELSGKDLPVRTVFGIDKLQGDPAVANDVGERRES
jgi:hypothetical protein